MAHRATRYLPLPKMTWADYEQLPDDGIRYEVLEGDLVMTPAPGFEHQVASGNVFRAVDRLRRAARLGGQVLTAPFDVVLADISIVQPDLVYLSPRTLLRVVNGRLSGPPDLAVEIFNARGASRDRVAKLRVYAKYGIPEYWLIDLDARSLTILVFRGKSYRIAATGTGVARLASPCFKGLKLRPRDLFQGL